MTSIPNKPNWTLAIGLPVLVMIACTIIVFSPVFLLKPDALSTGITLDLTLTAPLLYFLVIRGSRVPKMTVVRVFIAGILLAGLLLHNRPHSFLSLLKTWVAPLAEGLVLFLIAKKFYQARRAAAALGEEEDFLSRCRMILKEVTGNEKLGYMLASEMAVLYYTFIPQKRRTARWSKRGPAHAGSGIDEPSPVCAFTSYKTNGILLILGVFLCIFFVETVGLHFLMGLWSKKGAWVLTTLGVYTALQLYAHMRAIRSRPILIGEQSLELRNGLAADVSVRIDNIGEIFFDGKKGKKDKDAAPLTVKLALLRGLENHNILLRLKQPLLVNRFFGIRQKADTLLFFVDRPEDFLSAVRAKMGE
ncbi:MAG TPA: hypothetical protein VF939_01525 [Puia sp.]